MTKIRKILFPVDLSPVSSKIAPYVISFSETFGADLHVLFVARLLEHYAGMYVSGPAISTFESEIVRGAERRISEFADESLHNYTNCMAKVVTGDPSEQIMFYIEKEKIDMVIMGTHGRKGLDRVLFGSVAERVVKMATCPVLTVNPYRVERI